MAAELNIEDITIKDHLGNIEIINVFPLNLWNLSAIYQVRQLHLQSRCSQIAKKKKVS